MNEEQILNMDNVDPKTAASYLGIGYSALTAMLKNGVAPFGCATKVKSNYAYHISPGLLVAYKKGTLQINVNVGLKEVDDDKKATIKALLFDLL